MYQAAEVYQAIELPQGEIELQAKGHTSEHLRGEDLTQAHQLGLEFVQSSCGVPTLDGHLHGRGGLSQLLAHITCWGACTTSGPSNGCARTGQRLRAPSRGPRTGSACVGLLLQLPSRWMGAAYPGRGLAGRVSIAGLWLQPGDLEVALLLRPCLPQRCGSITALQGRAAGGCMQATEATLLLSCRSDRSTSGPSGVNVLVAAAADRPAGCRLLEAGSLG